MKMLDDAHLIMEKDEEEDNILINQPLGISRAQADVIFKRFTSKKITKTIVTSLNTDLNSVS